jgi:hypothetical protein
MSKLTQEQKEILRDKFLKTRKNTGPIMPDYPLGLEEKLSYEESADFWLNIIDELLENPRIYGKSIKSYIEFFELGKKGKAIIYATPQGNFVTPKQLQNELDQAYQQGAKDKVEEVREIIDENIETVNEFTGDGIVTKDMKNAMLIALKDVKVALLKHNT